MCDPTGGLMAGASTALQLGGVAAGFAGQSAQAEEARRVQNARYLQTSRAAEANFNRAISQTARQQGQIRAAASDQAMSASLDNLVQQGQARAAFGSTGNTGNSASALFRAFEAQQGRDRNNIRTNMQGDLQASFDRLEEFRAQQQSRINSALPQPVSSPSMLSALFQAGGIAASGYSDYLRLTNG